VPLAILLSATVGVPVVFQHTPRSVIVLPPSPVTVPPAEAVMFVIADTALVVTPSGATIVTTAVAVETLPCVSVTVRVTVLAPILEASNVVLSKA